MLSAKEDRNIEKLQKGRMKGVSQEEVTDLSNGNVWY